MAVKKDFDGGQFRQDIRWYRPEYEGKRYLPLHACVDRLWCDQKYRRDSMLKYMRMYGNLPFLGLTPRTYARKTGSTLTRSRLAFNVVKSCCDAYTAKLTKDRPKVTFVTSGGDWELQKRAEQLDKFVEGQFYESELYEQAPLYVMDSAVNGCGIAKVFADTDGDRSRIRIERCLPWEILIDDEEAAYGEVRTIYHRRFIDRLVLMEMFPEHAADIAKETLQKDASEDWGSEPVADQLVVIEAWHLRSGANANDGRHVICLPTVDLLDEEYEKPYLPFVPLRRYKPLVGWWGDSLAGELEGIQYELNVLLQKIQRSHHLMAASHWLIENGSHVNPNKIDNDIGSIFRYSGTPPQVITPPAVSPEVYQHLDRLYAKAFETTGISQLSAQSQIPAGFDPKSGKALRTYSNIESERFSVSFREYQHWFLNLAKVILDLAKDIGERDKNYSVKATGRNLMRKIKWADVHLEEDEYVLKLYPTNALSGEPADRIAQVQEFANAGWIDANDAKRLLDFPDLEAFSNLENASYNLVMDIIEGFKEGKYIGPEPFMDLASGIKWVQLSYLKAIRDGVPEEHLQLFRTWIADAQDILNPPPANDNGNGQGGAPPMPGAPMPPMPPPPAGPPPGAPPVPPVPAAPPGQGVAA